jgi:hypothetical protein
MKNQTYAFDFSYAYLDRKFFVYMDFDSLAFPSV